MANQRQKAVDTSYRLPSVPTSTSSDGTVNVPTTPGAGKKPRQKKRCRTEETTSLSKTKTVHVASACPQAPDVKPDSNNDFV